jgi:competence protein ComEC
MAAGGGARPDLRPHDLRPHDLRPHDLRPHDLRLAALAMGTWSAAFASLHTRAPLAFTAAGVALVAAAVAWQRVGRAGAWAGIAAALMLGAVCGATATGARLVARDAAPVAHAASEHAHVTAEVTVRRSPHRLGNEVGRPPSWLVPVWLHRIDAAGGPPVEGRVRLLVLTGDPGWQAVLPGQRLVATGRLAPPRGGDLTAAVLSADGPPQPRGDPPWVQLAAGSLRAGLLAASAPLPDEPGGLLPGVAVGDVSQLDPGVREDFLTTGMTHLAAVSGTHCAIVVGFVFLLARLARAPPWLVATVSGCAVVGYVILCQASPSVVRAGVMAVIALIALATGRTRAAVPALGATVTVLVVVDPQLAGTPGFALSILATAGLLLLAPRWRDALRRRGVPPGLAEALAVPAAAQVAVSPLIAGMSGTISLVAVAANLLAAPVMVPATLAGVLTALAHPVWPTAAGLLAWVGSWPAWWLVLVARYGAMAPAAVVSWPDGWTGGLLLAALTVTALVALRRRALRWLVAVVAVAAAVGALPVAVVTGGWPPRDAVLVACAVGQGDLVVLPVGPGEAVVVDAGPDPFAADRCLRDLGVRSVPLLVVSHYHVDHVGGVDGVFRHRDVGAVLTTPLPEPETGRDLLESAAAVAAAPVRVAHTGETYRAGSVSLRVIGPPEPMRGTRSDSNNNSLVIIAEVAGVRVLLAGDAETELQQVLLARYGAAVLRADVLKLAHHGSVYQDPAFLDAVEPAVVVVPVGQDNPYGHPHPEVLLRLQRGGARVLRTDTDGDVAALRTGGGLAVAVRGAPP